MNNVFYADTAAVPKVKRAKEKYERTFYLYKTVRKTMKRSWCNNIYIFYLFSVFIQVIA